MWYVRVSGREGEGFNGSNGFNCHNRNQLRHGHPSGLQSTDLWSAHIHICALVQSVNHSVMELYWLEALPSQ